MGKVVCIQRLSVLGKAKQNPSIDAKTRSAVLQLALFLLLHLCISPIPLPPLLLALYSLFEFSLSPPRSAFAPFMAALLSPVPLASF